MAAAAMTASVLCEIGPVGARALHRDTGKPVRTADADLAQAAITAGDDPLTLLGNRAVSTESVWRDALTPVIAGADSCLLVHPSWWPQPRVAAVARVAADLGGPVQAVSRAAMLVRRFRTALVIEIAPHCVLISTPTGAFGYCESRSAATDVVARAVARRVDQVATRQVCIDAADGVPGGAVTAGLIATRLRAAGVRVHMVDRRDIAAGAPVESTTSAATEPRRDRRPVAIAAVAAAVAVGMVIVLPTLRSDSDDIQVATETTALVEGRATAQIPVGWVVRRVSTGPGSARIEVAPSQAGDAVLHVTQSRVSDGDLAATAVALRAALDVQPVGVFADFNPADQREGRPAVTYREIRAGHDIRWTVIVDDNVRIGIGCQSAPARTDEVEAACADAVRTARRIE